MGPTQTGAQIGIPVTTTTLRLGLRQFDFHHGWRCPDDKDPRKKAADRFFTGQWLRQFKSSVVSMAAIRRLLSSAGASGELCRMTDQDVIDEFAVLLKRGVFHVHVVPLRKGGLGVAGEEEAAAPAASVASAARPVRSQSRKAAADKKTPAPEALAKPEPGGSKKGGAPKIPKECPYLDKPYTVEASKANFDAIREPATLTKPKDIKYKFPGDAAEQDALEYEVDVNGRKKKLIMPKNPPKDTSIPTAQQLAAALGAVPGPQLDKITQIAASPKPNPDDAYWAKEYKIPDFSSAATGGTSGVTFYPKKHNKWTQEFTDSTMIHEGGHSYSKNLWSDEDKKKAWEKAMSSDGRSPSKYADSSADEDFSESLVMYSLSKGTTCEATAKQLYPNRYQALDDLFGVKKP